VLWKYNVIGFVDVLSAN